MIRVCLAVDFDKSKNDEVFQEVRLTNELAQKMIQDVLNNMDYAERRAWVQQGLENARILSTTDLT